MSKPLLEVKSISKRFGGNQAVKEISFHVDHGEILGLIGPNGAGKTTAFNMIAGYHLSDTGDILLNGNSIKGLKPWDVCRAGIARTFQLSRPFGDLSVIENVMVGGFVRSADRGEIEEKARKIIDFLGMTRVAEQEAHDLTAFDRRKLELGRALATEPKLLLMDEVVAGATPSEAAEMVDLVKKVQATGVSILIVEHVMHVIMNLSHLVIVLDYGNLIASGDPHVVVNDPEVLKAYFGERYVQQSA